MIFAVAFLILLGLLSFASGIVWAIYTVSEIVQDGFIIFDIIVFICCLVLFALAFAACHIAIVVL